MRIAVAGLFEEVNTFAVESLGFATITGNMTTGFQQWADQALIDGYIGSKTYIGGFLDGFAETPEVEVVPTALWSFSAGPTIDGAVYEQMKQDIVDRLAAALPLDGVALQLHGAGVAEGVDDVEADLTGAVRQVVGPDVKIACAIDHHSNLTDEHLHNVDLITIVHHYPHVDMYDTALRAARLLPGIISGEIEPHGHFEHIPILLSCQSTMDGCLHAPIRQKVEEFAQRAGVHEFSFAYGFPFADVPFNTATVNCWAESADLASDTAREFATLLWENRRLFVCKPVSAADAVDRALDALVQQGRVLPNEVRRPEVFDESQALPADPSAELERTSGFVPDTDAPGPVLIAEKSDNPGGGAPGDATHVLHELIRNKVEQAAVCTIRDAETVQQAIAAGVGNEIDVELGGKLSSLSGEPVRGKAYVKTIGDNRYTVVSPMGRGMKFDTGPAVGLTIGGVDVAVVSGVMQPFDAAQMKNVGFDPCDYRVVVLKSANHFRAWWTDIASAIIDCDPPGIASNDLASFTFRNKIRDAYPLDPDTVYSAP